MQATHPIQLIPPIYPRLGLDVVGMARTGSGKTAAFVLPMIARLGQHASRHGCRGIILSPTRELCLQTYHVVTEFAGRSQTDLRVACLLGGEALDAQFEALASNQDLIVATPGRLMHHLHQVSGFTLQLVETMVFDEADRLFEMGFADQLREILSRLPESRQTLLFSATMPRMLVEFARAGLREPELVRLDVDTKVSPRSIAQLLPRPRGGQARRALVFTERSPPHGSHRGLRGHQAPRRVS